MTGAPFTSLALDAHARYLAVGRRGEPTGVWDLSARRRIATVPAFDVGIVSADESSPVLAFEPGTDVLAVGRSDGTVLLWNPVSRRQIGSKLKISDGSVISIGFSPDGSILAVGLTFTDGVLLYDARTLQEIGQLGSDGGIVTSLAFSPDGRTLATGDQHGRVRLWSLSAADWARRLCDVVHRDITAREWTTVAGDLPRTAVCPTPR
jgi:WD40 repeat protein